MTATQTQLRRGTEAQCDAGTPVEGEIWVDTTNDRIRIGDAVTTGGIECPNAYDLQDGVFTSATSASGTNELTLVFDPPITSYVSGMEIAFFAPNTNTGSMTIDAGDGAVAFEKVSGGAITAMVAGDVVSGAPYRARFNGTKFIQVGGAGGVSQVTGADGITVSPTSGSPVVRLNTDNALGVGSIVWAAYGSSTLLANGSTTSGGNLSPLILKTASVWGNFTFSYGSSLTGTWRNISGASLQSGGSNVGLFQRTA